jgi:hypothetical protein
MIYEKINYLCGNAPISSLCRCGGQTRIHSEKGMIRTESSCRKMLNLFSAKKINFIFQNPENVNLDLNPNSVLDPILEKRQDKKGSNSLLNIKTLK